MEKKKKIIIIILVLLIVTGVYCYKKNSYNKIESIDKTEKKVSGAVEKNNNRENHEIDRHTIDFSGYKKGVLTTEEKDAIIHMREEEKLARDIYRQLSKTTNSRVFENIPISEKRHMDAFSQLIDRYGLEDPIKSESDMGIFTDKKFEKFYKELVEKGKKSDKDAFETGMMIEDLNMANLIKYGNATDKKDLKLAYNTLLEQSKHHMSAFYRKLTQVGGEYNPKYINKKQMEEAVQSGKKHMQEEAMAGGEMAKELESEISLKK